MSESDFMRRTVALVCAVVTSLVANAADSVAQEWVFPKEGVKAKVDGREVDPEPMFVPAIVHAAEGDQLWVAQGWLNKSDVMSLDDAKSSYDEQVMLKPENPQGWHRRGLFYFVKHEYVAAHHDFTEAIRLDPQNAIFFCDRAAVRIERREFLLALADCNDALRLDSNCTLAYFYRGVNWARQNEYDQAIADLTEAIRLDSTIGYFFTSRSSYWLSKGLHDLAIADLNRAIERDPKDASICSSRGSCWYWKRQFAKAISDFEQAIRLGPNNFDGHQGLAWVLATCPFGQLRDGNKAVKHAERACELTLRVDPVCLSTLAAAYAEAGLWDKAISTQERYIKLAINEPSLSDGKYELELYEKGIPYHEVPTLWEIVLTHFWTILVVLLVIVGLFEAGWMMVWKAIKQRRVTRIAHDLSTAGGAALETISLKGERLAGFRLAQLTQMPDLHHLSLAETDIADDRLEELKDLSSLISLRLSRTRIGDSGLKHLSRLPNLKVVDLSDTRVTDRGLQCLSDLADLRELNLSETRISDVGLIELSRCHGLQRLDLTGTHITDTGLEQLRGLTNLTELWLGDTVTSPAGRAQLRESLPDCRIEPQP